MKKFKSILIYIGNSISKIEKWITDWINRLITWYLDSSFEIDFKQTDHWCNEFN